MYTIVMYVVLVVFRGGKKSAKKRDTNENGKAIHLSSSRSCVGMGIRNPKPHTDNRSVLGLDQGASAAVTT
jgi:hypothetical protein